MISLGHHFLSILLTEEEGRDLSCLVASLVQVMMDPYFRTITGFQSLIQKEWVMVGYQFLDRCNHLKRSEKEVISISALRDFAFKVCAVVVVAGEECIVPAMGS